MFAFFSVLSVPCSLMITSCERDDLLCVMFSCVYVTFPYGVPGHMLFLIISLPDFTFLPTFIISIRTCKSLVFN